jgi:uncharacterized membrane protein
MIPIVELRGALPVACFIYHMPIMEAFTISVIGNLIPVPFILLLFEPVKNFLVRYKTWDRFFNWLFARTRRHATKKIERFELFGLALFVSVPLPVTGAWTGSLVSYLFGFSPRRGFIAILAGVLLAGIIVSVICLTGNALWFISS